MLAAGSSDPLGFYSVASGDQVFSSLKCLLRLGSGEFSANVSILNVLASCALSVAGEHFAWLEVSLDLDCKIQTDQEFQPRR